MGRSAKKTVSNGKNTMKNKSMKGGMGESWQFSSRYSPEIDDKLIAFIDTVTYETLKISFLPDINKNKKMYMKYSIKLLEALKTKALSAKNTALDVRLLTTYIIEKRRAESSKQTNEEQIDANSFKFSDELFKNETGIVDFTPDENGNTLLHKILIEGTINDLNSLLDITDSKTINGILNNPNNESLTPFMLAIINPNENLWNLLYGKFSGKIRINIITEKEISLLPVVPSGLPASTEKVTLPKGLNILHLAAFLSRKTIITGKLESALQFMDLCAGLINNQDDKGNTPLYYSVISGDINVDIVSALLSKGADVMIKNKENKGPIDLVNSLANVIKEKKNGASQDEIKELDNELGDINKVKALLDVKAKAKQDADAKAATDARAAEASAAKKNEEQIKLKVNQGLFNFVKKLYEEGNDKTFNYTSIPNSFTEDEYAVLIPKIQTLIEDIDETAIKFGDAEFRKDILRQAMEANEKNIEANRLKNAQVYYEANKNNAVFKKSPFLDENGNVKNFDEAAYNNNTDGYKTTIDKELEINSEFKNYTNLFGKPGYYFGKNTTQLSEEKFRKLYESGAYRKMIQQHEEAQKRKTEEEKKLADEKARSDYEAWSKYGMGNASAFFRLSTAPDAPATGAPATGAPGATGAGGSKKKKLQKKPNNKKKTQKKK